MVQILKIIQVITKIAALFAAFETISRLVKFAWSLWVQLGRVFGRRTVASATFSRGFGKFSGFSRT
ncbi:MAG: hypothetical protein R2688_05390 [Fimbriimonadaceae bacterium]